MKRFLYLVFVLIIGFLPEGLSYQETANEWTEEDVVLLEYRELVPGEVIKVSVKKLSDIESAQVKFLDEKYNTAEQGGHLICLIGLDLGIEPGTYPFEIFLFMKQGQVIEIHKEVFVNPKQFPVKKLWVKEEYVTPPQSVLDRIREEAELVKAVYDIDSPEWAGKGRFIIPVEGEIFPNFGERRIFNNEPRSPHSGIDIASPEGTLVRASNSGRIVLANDLYFSGKTVIIDHGLGVFSLCCHFSEILVKNGTKVEKGEVIGKIGSTGRVTGPHLHWSIRIRGSRVDPHALLNLVFE